MTTHYRPYDDEPAACGAFDTRTGDIPGNITDVQDDVTCEDCKYEIR